MIDNGSIKYIEGYGVYIEHICDYDFIIGNLEEAKKFMSDLQKTIEEAERLNTKKTC